MGWFAHNVRRRTEPASSFEGRAFAQIIRNEPDLKQRMRQSEYDNSISKVHVSRILPSVAEIDLRADRAAYTRAIKSGYSKEEAMDLIVRIRNNRQAERAEKAMLIASVQERIA